MDTHIPPGQKPDDPASPTIVGGRPSEDGSRLRDIPRGLEVLLKKASVDQGFRSSLLEQRSRACEAIGLKLDPTETAMLDTMPAGQLEAIIRATRVRAQDRRIFLGKAASVMLAALGVGASGCTRRDQTPGPTLGIRPDQEFPQTRGIQPDREFLLIADGIRQDRLEAPKSKREAASQKGGESNPDANNGPLPSDQNPLVQGDPDRQDPTLIPGLSPELHRDIRFAARGHTIDMPQEKKGRQ